KGVAVSKSAFLFGFKNNDPEGIEIFPLRNDKRHEAQRVKPHEGPTFGDGDLSLKTMSFGSSQTGNSFENWRGSSLFADADEFKISDIEVLYPKDSLCKEPCNHYEGHCDEITTKCVCDWTERNVEWCLEGDPKKIINLYDDAASYWPLDSVEDLKDRARLGWGQAHGAVSLVAKGLSGQAIQLDGASGWVDLGDLGTLYQVQMCTEDFSISMWMKYYSKGNGEDQTFLHFDNGLTVAELFYEATSKLVGVSLSTSSLKFCYRFPVAKGFWTHLGFSWKNDSKSLIIQ
ncbi:uncharacterized protein LOC111320153, partial [Stylophora pistillata]|uniref:uncharacterized protein LOC111320153 n=1 Tax=Stylophora pistillata TaxID=50429 RepID=UPI000C05677B